MHALEAMRLSDMQVCSWLFCVDISLVLREKNKSLLNYTIWCLIIMNYDRYPPSQELQKLERRTLSQGAGT
jgi:hypothetical protein